MAKIFIINDTSITGGVDTVSDIGSSSIRWGNGWIAKTLTVGTVSASGLIASGTLTVGTVSATGNVIAGATVSGASGVITTLLTAGTSSFSGNLIVGGVASVTGAIIGSASLTISTGTIVAAKITATTVSATGPGIFGGNISALNLVSGTYTPSLTNIANLDASTAYSCQYLQYGSTVTVSGRVDVDPTLTVTATSLDISLPVSSTLASSNLCAGVAASPGIAGQVMAIVANTASNVAQMQWKASDVTSQGTWFTFTYRVV